jgi:hypothetical protein
MCDCVDFALLCSESEVTSRVPSGRPLDGEFADYAKPDIERVIGDDAVRVLAIQARDTLALLKPLHDPDVSGITYAPGKWTVKQVIGHLSDDERIFAYRALCVARNDPRPLAGFDEALYVQFAGFESRSVAQLAAEYCAVRRATIALFEGLSAEAWVRRGIVNGYSASARGLAFHIAGHELRHVRALRERYGLNGRR